MTTTQQIAEYVVNTGYADMAMIPDMKTMRMAPWRTEFRVRLPDGSERSFDLEPTGIAAGRVRGRDKAADIERTLPVSRR